MNYHPCQREYNEYVLAMEKWEKASAALKVYNRDGGEASAHDLESFLGLEFQAAAEKAERAFERFKEKLDAYMQCLENHERTGFDSPETIRPPRAVDG